MELFFGLILSALFALSIIFLVNYVKCLWYLDHNYKEDPIKKEYEYVAARDIDSELHYFNSFKEATQYIWEPLSKELFHDKQYTSVDYNQLYDSFIKGVSDERWELNIPADWKKYSLYGGCVERIEKD